MQLYHTWYWPGSPSVFRISRSINLSKLYGALVEYFEKKWRRFASKCPIYCSSLFAMGGLFVRSNFISTRVQHVSVPYIIQHTFILDRDLFMISIVWSYLPSSCEFYNVPVFGQISLSTFCQSPCQIVQTHFNYCLIVETTAIWFRANDFLHIIVRFVRKLIDVKNLLKEFT